MTACSAFLALMLCVVLPIHGSANNFLRPVVDAESVSEESVRASLLQEIAATIEHMIHNETQRRLAMAYESTDVDQSEDLIESQVDMVVKQYMKIFIFGEKHFRKAGDGAIDY